MKRKTNIFNLNKENNDTTFLTFSNYAEYITGNFLSTCTRLFPSVFICLNLPYNDECTVEGLKYFLMQYYENKLATLRDHFKVNDSLEVSKHFTPLFYLIEGLHKYFGKDPVEDPLQIVYKSDVVEQDYKGTYTDTLCIINLNEVWNSADDAYTKSSSENQHNLLQADETETLYGWDASDIQTIYGETLAPIFDSETEYDVESNIESINFKRAENTSNMQITFNCIIPLFDVMNVEHDVANTDEALLESINVLDSVYKNIPIGIWLPETPVTIAKYNGFSQNWSLVIGSKFSALPYGTVEEAKNSDTTNDDIKYLTWAQILYQQNELYKKFNEHINNQHKLESTLENIQSQINVLLTKGNFDLLRDEFKEEIQKLKNDTQKELDTMKEIVAGLRWKVSAAQK